MKEENKPVDISVVILCYKEGQIAADLIKEIQRLLADRALSYELVLVANYYAAEKDAPAVLENARILGALAKADDRLVIVAKEKQGGFGWDVRAGLEAATGKTVALIDGDGQVPAADIIRVYNILSGGDYDCVKTYRVRRDDGTWRAIISTWYNLFIRFLFPRVYSGDVNGKPKIFTRVALQKLRLTSSDWFIDAEMIIQGSYLGFRFAEISAIFNEMTHRKSYIRPMAIVESVKNLLVYRLTRMRELRSLT